MVVGNIILRFVGSLALVQNSAEITKFFLGTEAAAIRSGPSWWMRAHGCSY